MNALPRGAWEQSAAQRVLWLLIFMPQQGRHHKTRLGCRLNAGGAEWDERHGCRESAARTWMSVRRGPTERRRSEGTRRSRPNQEHRTLGYLGSFQVTRRRRNSLAVRTNHQRHPGQWSRTPEQVRFHNGSIAWRLASIALKLLQRLLRQGNTLSRAIIVMPRQG